MLPIGCPRELPTVSCTALRRGLGSGTICFQVFQSTFQGILCCFDLFWYFCLSILTYLTCFPRCGSMTNAAHASQCGRCLLKNRYRYSRRGRILVGCPAEYLQVVPVSVSTRKVTLAAYRLVFRYILIAAYDFAILRVLIESRSINQWLHGMHPASPCIPC